MKKAFSLIFLTSSLFADSTTWVGGSGDWNDNSKWSNGVPLTTQDVFFTSPSNLPNMPDLIEANAKSLTFSPGSETLLTSSSTFLLVNSNNGTSIYLDGSFTLRGVIIVYGYGIVELNSDFNFIDGTQFEFENGNIKGTGTLNLDGGLLAGLQFPMGTLTIDTGNFYLTNRASLGQISSKSLIINSGSITSENSSIGPNMGEVIINGGSMNLSASDLASSSMSVTISGGTINLTNSSQICAQNSSPMNFSNNAYITLDTTSSIGPTPIFMTGGLIENNGTINLGYYVPYELPSRVPGHPSFYGTVVSIFNSGTISGIGTLNIPGTAIIYNSISQDLTRVGWGIPDGYVYGFAARQGDLFCNGTLTSQVVVTGSGSLYGTGIVIGDTEVQAGGLISPGGLEDPTNHLKIQGSITFDSGSFLEINFDNTGHDLLTINEGNLNITNGALLSVLAYPPYDAAQVYRIVELTSSYENLNGAINGTFTINGAQPLIGYNVVYNSNNIQLETELLGFNSFAETPNQQSLANVLDTLDGNTNECLQAKLDQIKLLTQKPLELVYNDLEPSELKGQQVVFEEMNFIMNDQLSNLLYSKNNKPSGHIFVIGGFERLRQQSFYQYAGFSANAGYELIGGIYVNKTYNVMASLGALETSVHYKSVPTKSSSTSIIGSLGGAYLPNRWALGIDALFDVNFMSATRRIEYFNLDAKSSHFGYGGKVEGNISYKRPGIDTDFMIYDRPAFNYLYENSFKEHGAECLSLNIQSSSRWMIRNTFGFAIEGLKTRHVHPYLDLAYVFEKRYSGQLYYASFVDTSPKMRVRGVPVSKNFGKIQAGLRGAMGKASYSFNLNGMYGQRFFDYGASASADFKF